MTARDSELLEDAGHVVFQSLDRDPQLFGTLAVRVTTCDETDDLAFASSQAPQVWRIRIGEVDVVIDVEEVRGDFWL